MHVDSLQEQLKKFIQFDNRGYLIVVVPTNLISSVKVKNCLSSQKKKRIVATKVDENL